MASSEKESVALISLFASALLTVGKLVAGSLTGSLGIMSEAIHNFADFGATVITWFAVRWSDQPPDEEHHYGHAKAESVAALIETGLLFLITFWIVYEACRRLWLSETDVELTWWAVAIVAVSVVIDFNRARALQRVADATSSEALAADALHFSTDMWSSLAVLAGLAGVWLGFASSDAIAALFVSLFVAVAAWRLGRRTLATLLDTAPEGATARIARIVEETSGVLALRQLRLRPAGPTLFASVVVEVPRTMAADAITDLKTGLGNRIRASYPNADVTVAADLVALDSESVRERVMLIAAREKLPIHHLTVQQIGAKLSIGFDLEVPGETPLGAAHDTASQLEAAIRQDFGADIEVDSHIEPAREDVASGREANAAEHRRIETALRKFGQSEGRLSDLHNVRVRRSGDDLFVHYHCRFDPGDSVELVHSAIDRIENAIAAKFPSIKRIIAHAEPVRVRDTAK